MSLLQRIKLNKKSENISRRKRFIWANHSRHHFALSIFISIFPNNFCSDRINLHPLFQIFWLRFFISKFVVICCWLFPPFFASWRSKELNITPLLLCLILIFILWFSIFSLSDSIFSSFYGSFLRNFEILQNPFHLTTIASGSALSKIYVHHFFFSISSSSLFKYSFFFFNVLQRFQSLN